MEHATFATTFALGFESRATPPVRCSDDGYAVDNGSDDDYGHVCCECCNSPQAANVLTAFVFTSSMLRKTASSAATAAIVVAAVAVKETCDSSTRYGSGRGPSKH